MIVQPGGWSIKVKAKHEGSAKISTSTSPSTSPSNALAKKIELNLKAKQDYGDINGLAYDLDGDGKWDSATDNTIRKGKLVTFPKISYKYSTNGKYSVKFKVRDSEGNEAEIFAEVNGGERKPSVQLLPKDTTIVLCDEILFRSSISEVGGKLASYTWDFNGDGKLEDSTTVNDTLVERSVKHTYTDTGVYILTVKAWDTDKKSNIDSSRVTVIQKPLFNLISKPVDTTISILDTVIINAVVRNDEGKLLKLSMDYEASGKWEDSLASQQVSIKYSAKHCYKTAGLFKALLLV